MRAPLSHLALLTVLLPLPLAAQERFALEFRGGQAVPTGDLARVSGSGLTLGGGVAVRIRGPLRVRVDLEASFLEEGEPEPGVQSPGVNFVHRTGGLELLLGRAGRSGPRVSANLGAGVSTFEIEGYVARTGPDAGRSFTSSETYPVVTGGLAAEFGAGRLVALVARTGLRRADRRTVHVAVPANLDSNRAVQPRLDLSDRDGHPHPLVSRMHARQVMSDGPDGHVAAVSGG